MGNAIAVECPKCHDVIDDESTHDHIRRGLCTSCCMDECCPDTTLTTCSFYVEGSGVCGKPGTWTGDDENEGYEHLMEQGWEMDDEGFVVKCPEHAKLVATREPNGGVE